MLVYTFIDKDVPAELMLLCRQIGRMRWTAARYAELGTSRWAEKRRGASGRRFA